MAGEVPVARDVPGGPQEEAHQCGHGVCASWFGSSRQSVWEAYAGSIGLTWMLVVAVDPDAPSALVLAALAVARLGVAVPLSPSGLGVQEGILGLLFVGVGLPPDTALAALLLARISLLITTALGATLLLRSRTVPEREAPLALTAR